MKIICIVLSLILIFGAVYYFSPTSLLEDVVADEVGCIVVQHGSSGARFTVVGDGEIRAILQNLQSVTVKRDGLSIKEDGFGYQLTLMDQQGQSRLVHHLLYASPVKRGNGIEVIEDILPVYGIECRIRTEKPIKRVYLAPQMVEIPFTQENGSVRYTVEKLENHQMVVLDY